MTTNLNTAMIKNISGAPKVEVEIRINAYMSSLEYKSVKSATWLGK